MSVEKICSSCTYWERNDDGYYKSKSIPFWGSCNNEKFIYGYDAECPKDGLVYSDSEGYAAGFSTGEKFGCIHFKYKKE